VVKPLANTVRCVNSCLFGIQWLKIFYCERPHDTPVDSLLEPMEAVLGNRETDKHLRVSALSIIGVACQTCPVALTDRLWSLMHWILTILDFEKEVEIRRGEWEQVY
jgi:hypothetical protein